VRVGNPVVKKSNNLVQFDELSVFNSDTNRKILIAKEQYVRRMNKLSKAVGEKQRKKGCAEATIPP
jgi:2'-5' RNA ligase